jgi:hypothetical protein
MNIGDILITSCKLGKKIVMGYWSHIDNYDYKVDNDDAASEKLKNAINAFNQVLAESFYIDTAHNAAHFITNGFVIHEKDGVQYLEIKGKCVTKHGDPVNVSSGKIPYEEAGKTINGLIWDKLQDARLALFEFMFSPKPVQKEIEHKE